MSRPAKIRLILIGLVIAAGAVGVFAFVFRDRVYYRSPVLYVGRPRITFATGDVRFRARPSDEWRVADVGSLLGTGYEIETGSRSAADVRFQSNTAVRLKADSHLVLDEATIRGINLRLPRGNAYGQFKRLFQQQDIQITTPTATTYVRGTELGFELIEIDPALLRESSGDRDAKPTRTAPDNIHDLKKIKATRVFALSGIVEVWNPEFSDTKIILSYQNSAIVPAGGPPLEPEKITEKETERIRRILNSIHYEDVVLISNQLRFEFASDRLLAGSAQELDKIAAVLKTTPDRVRIEGHTDNIGSTAANYRLSLARARAIRNALIERGVPAGRLIISGHGENKPITENDTEAGRQTNRRAEFLIAE